MPERRSTAIIGNAEAPNNFQTRKLEFEAPWNSSSVHNSYVTPRQPVGNVIYTWWISRPPVQGHSFLFLETPTLTLDRQEAPQNPLRADSLEFGPRPCWSILSCNGHHSTAQRFLHPSLLRTAATLTQLEAREGIEQGGGRGVVRGVVGRQRARPERQETCPAGASGRWQRMRSASPGLSSTRTRGLSVVDRGTQTSCGGAF